MDHAASQPVSSIRRSPRPASRRARVDRRAAGAGVRAGARQRGRRRRCRPSARSPSTRPTRRKRSARAPAGGQVSVRRTGRARPPRLARIGVPRRASAATSSSFPATTTAATSSSPISVEAREFLPVDEMERVSCSDSCPGLFSQLKEVYLFGCNTLNPEARKRRPREIGRSLRALRPLARRRRARLARALERAPRREQPRPHAPDLQGRAGDLRLFVGGAARADGGVAARAAISGRRRARSRHRPRERAAARAVRRARRWRSPAGSADGDSAGGASARRLPASPTTACRRRRSSTSSTSCSQRDMAEVRMFLDRIERWRRRCRTTQPRTPDVARCARRDRRDDRPPRDRYLDFARDADQPSRCARACCRLARNARLAHADGAAGRADADDRRAARAHRRRRRRSRPRLHAQRGSRARQRDDRLRLAQRCGRRSVAHAAILACLGERRRPRGDRCDALTSQRDDDVADRAGLSAPPSDRRCRRASRDHRRHRAHARRRLRRCARSRRWRSIACPIRESLEALTRLFPVAESVGCQTAIAGVLIRADYDAIASPRARADAARSIGCKSRDGEDLIDVLIRRLEQP